ncbi:MAG TPA: hypothetical protein VLM85_15515 [Polyangiaceae bacterium]|nr:hypothetical protein [Polyangiaceae bacterium]
MKPSKAQANVGVLHARRLKNIVLVVSLALASAGAVACDPPGAGESESAKSPSGEGENKYAKEDEEPVTPELEAKAAKVQVLENTSGLGCPTEVIGLVDVHEPVKTVDQALRELRLDAARLGAQAVVGVEFHHGEPGEEPTHLSGQAVRCNDLLKGRAYDVLGDVQVTEKMGSEEALLAALKSKAKSVGADLLLDVKFDHGEGGDEAMKMSGTAIRFKSP